MAERKDRSRIQILWYISQFSLSRTYGDGRVYGGLEDYAFNENRSPPPGSLVALQSAPCSKWYLSWVVSSQWPEGHACQQYTLESIEDGELCDWSNVGIAQMNPKTVREHPEWRWTDAQHEFGDRWRKVCRGEPDGYGYPSVPPVFGGGDSVELGVREKWTQTAPHYRALPNWRKVTQKAMRAFHAEAVAHFKASRPPGQFPSISEGAQA